MRDGQRQRAPGGMTLLEVMISLSVFSVVIGATLMAVIPVTRSEGVLAADTRLHASARKALQRLANDLRQAGNNVTIGGLVYPHIWAPYDPVNGPDDADSGFEAYNTLPPGTIAAVHDALFGDPDYGATTHIAFRIPFDQDGNGVPTAAAGGSVEWTTNDIVYFLVQDPALGINELRRYTDYAGGVYETVAMGVERLMIERDDLTGAVWDDDALSDNQDELRLTIQLRMPDPAATGVWVRGTVVTVVNMRN